ncbi:MAG: DUF3853 family protein [Bacteroidetes bacterium]|nr:DUF3853 family protein [Bacteroidota bacterium]
MTILYQKIKEQQTAHSKIVEAKMEKENFYFTMQEIADQLGVSPSSIMRWVDSGKLKCAMSDGEQRIFSVDHLTEFAMTYNISMKFLESRKLSAALRNERMKATSSR